MGRENMVKRISFAVVLFACALLSGCGPMPDEYRVEDINMQEVGGVQVDEAASAQAEEEVCAKIEQMVASDPDPTPGYVDISTFGFFKPTTDNTGRLDGRAVAIELLESYVGEKMSHFTFNMTWESYFLDCTKKSSKYLVGFWAQKVDGDWEIVEFTDEEHRLAQLDIDRERAEREGR